jgi:hypothetical protein
MDGHIAKPLQPGGSFETVDQPAVGYPPVRGSAPGHVGDFVTSIRPAFPLPVA